MTDCIDLSSSRLFLQWTNAAVDTKSHVWSQCQKSASVSAQLWMNHLHEPPSMRLGAHRGREGDKNTRAGRWEGELCSAGFRIWRGCCTATHSTCSYCPLNSAMDRDPWQRSYSGGWNHSLWGNMAACSYMCVCLWTALIGLTGLLMTKKEDMRSGDR